MRGDDENVLNDESDVNWNFQEYILSKQIFVERRPRNVDNQRRDISVRPNFPLAEAIEIKSILDSERSEQCIGFTAMVCFILALFYVCT